MLTALPSYGQQSQHASDNSLKSATKLRSLQKRSLEFLEFPVAQVPNPIHARDRASYHRWMIEKAAELKALCKENDLKQSGKKAELVERLKEAGVGE